MQYDKCATGQAIMLQLLGTESLIWNTVHNWSFLLKLEQE